MGSATQVPCLPELSTLPTGGGKSLWPLRRGKDPGMRDRPPIVRQGRDRDSPPSRAATSPCAQQGQALWGPTASAPPPRHPQPSAPRSGAPHSPARYPEGMGCPPSPSPGSAAGSGPGLPHSLRTRAGVRAPPEPHNPTRQEPRGSKRSHLSHLPSPGSRAAQLPDLWCP